MRVLVLNPGSATLKATVVDPPERTPRFERTADWTTDAPAAERERALDDILGAAEAEGLPADSVDVVGYRAVHGGSRFTAPVVVDDAVVAQLDGLADLAPLHNPLAVATIRVGRSRLPAVPHVAAFDTAFHASLPEAAYRYPVPRGWYDDRGIRRYGFHGLSVAWSVRRAGELLGRPTGDLRLVVAHLGGGCSVTAVDGGRSVDTSMGMTPLEGLVMGTRSGSIDPGVIFRLLREGVPAETLAGDLEHRSGLLGVSGWSSDMRQLLAAEAAGDGAATLAVEVFVRRAAAGIAAAATVLPVLDAIVFTGGIGENSSEIRSRVAFRLGVLGVAAPAEGAGEDAVLTAAGPAVLRIGAREDLVIADAAVRVATELARG